MRRRRWLPVLLLTLLFAGLGQAMHLHHDEGPGHGAGAAQDHCDYCLQVARLGTGTAAPELAAARVVRLAAVVQRTAPRVARQLAHRYDARGPHSR